MATKNMSRGKWQTVYGRNSSEEADVVELLVIPGGVLLRSRRAQRDGGIGVVENHAIQFIPGGTAEMFIAA
jgi:hypothetical protein